MNNLTPWFYYMNGLSVVLLIIAMSVIVLIWNVVKRRNIRRLTSSVSISGFPSRHAVSCRVSQVSDFRFFVQRG
jgi:hypothetical protein